MGVLSRCDGCGALSWAVLGRPGASREPKCEICGHALKLERRRPGRKRFARASGERRDAQAPLEPLPPAG